MAILEIDTKREFERQGLELVNIKFIDDETRIYITRKKKKLIVPKY